MDIRPHEGPQEAFLSTSADIAVYGGQAGGGKTFALLMEPLRHMSIPGFGAVIFRRTSPQITREGGLWDESAGYYPRLGARPRESYHDWTFETGTRVAFASMEHETDRYDWDGSQIPLIGFDQVEHFTELQFFYMLGRNRSTCGVKPYVRATANPDPDSFIANFISWWIGDDGYPINSRSGKLRYFIRLGDDFVWSNNRRTLMRKHPGCLPLSVTFIGASIEDNPTLLEKDPLYVAKLQALPYIERMRLMKGNWKIRASAGMYFKRDYFEIVDRPENKDIIKRVRSWDLASSTPKKKNPEPDYTVGIELLKLRDNRWAIGDVDRFRDTPGKVKQRIRARAVEDGPRTIIRLSQDPGQAGAAQIDDLVGSLHGFTVHSQRETGSKETRASPVSTQCERNRVDLVRADWNEHFLTEVENFPAGRFDDQVDALANAFDEVAGETEPQIY